MSRSSKQMKSRHCHNKSFYGERLELRSCQVSTYVAPDTMTHPGGTSILGVTGRGILRADAGERRELADLLGIVARGALGEGALRVDNLGELPAMAGMLQDPACSILTAAAAGCRPQGPLGFDADQACDGSVWRQRIPQPVDDLLPGRAHRRPAPPRRRCRGSAPKTHYASRPARRSAPFSFSRILQGDENEHGRHQK